MARSSHDPLWKAALAAATRHADPIIRKDKPNPVKPGGPKDKDRGDVAKPQPRYELQNAPKKKEAAKPAPKDEGTKPDVSDDCDECTMPLEFCHCKDMARPASVEDDVLITEPSVPGPSDVADLDYPNEMDDKDKGK